VPWRRRHEKQFIKEDGRKERRKEGKKERKKERKKEETKNNLKPFRQQQSPMNLNCASNS